MPPINDNFVDAMVLTGINGSAPPLDNIGATTESGEPSGSDGRNFNSMWYRWTSPTSGNVFFTTSGSTRASDGGGLDTTLTVWTGASLGSLVEVASNDEDPDSFNTSAVTFTAVLGTTYYIQVANWNSGTVGTVLLSWGAVVFPAFNHIQFGDNLSITDLGGGRIRVDGKDVPTVQPDYSPTPMKIAYFKTAAPVAPDAHSLPGCYVRPYNWSSPPDVTPASGNLNLKHPEIYGSGGTLDTTKWMIHTEDPVATVYEVCLTAQFAPHFDGVNWIPSTVPVTNVLPGFSLFAVDKYGDSIYNGIDWLSGIQNPIVNYEASATVGAWMGWQGRFLVQMLRRFEPYTSGRPPGDPLYGRGIFNFGIAFVMQGVDAPTDVSMTATIARVSPPPWWYKFEPISFFE